jgi:ferredoxin-NADP reductase
MFSKFIIAIDKKHLFNPAAIAVLILSLFGFGNGIWWAGSTVLLPFFLIVGLLVVRKIRRFYLLWPFIVASLLTIVSINLGRGITITASLQQVITSWPLIFFGTIMLTEPLTTPPSKLVSRIYGAIVGVLFGSQFTIGPIHASPELALVVGNIFTYIVSPKAKPVLTFVAKRLIGSQLYEFDFLPSQRFTFLPGQYLEWTIDPVHADSRGNRRYFTIASSPTETEVKLGIKIGEKHSSFKQHLLELSAGDTIMASQLSGDFVLPADKKQKLVFIAGGIGITPFRSMAKYLTDTKEKRDITLFYACSNGNDFIYQNTFEAAQAIGMKTIYVITHTEVVPKDWAGETGRLDADMLQKHLSHCTDYHYYLSGPNAMVESYGKLLSELGVPRSQITTDYFPGF